MRKRRGSRGQALAEFALVFPVFVLILAGMIDFGLGLYSYNTIINAAREGARLGVTNCNAVNCTSAVQARAVANSNGLLSASGVTVTCYPAGSSTAEACSSSQSGDTVLVRVNYTYHMIWPLTFGTQIPLSASIEMMIA
jgi:Flp pilus assembly protein TadG